jgi:hypothetical protein
MRSQSKMDQVAFNVTLSSDPGESKTFWKAMDGRNRHKWELILSCPAKPGRNFPVNH